MKITEKLNLNTNMLKDLENPTADQLDTIESIFQKGVLEGTKHSSPSPETIARLEIIEKKINEITETFMTYSQTRDEHLQIMLSEFREGMKDVKRVTGLLDNSSFMVKFFVGVGSFMMFMGGAYLMLKQIFHGQN